jgi:hypothetical protein
MNNICYRFHKKLKIISYKIVANGSCSCRNHNSRQADIAVKLLLTLLLLVVVVINTTQPNFRQEQRDSFPVKRFHTVSQSTVGKTAMT